MPNNYIKNNIYSILTIVRNLCFPIIYYYYIFIIYIIYLLRVFNFDSLKLPIKTNLL